MRDVREELTVTQDKPRSYCHVRRNNKDTYEVNNKEVTKDEFDKYLESPLIEALNNVQIAINKLKESAKILRSIK